uniref:Uncharacterized protein n=1 Tax=Cryptomonas curvata TaxID=233186 RepID=A0A7S0M6J1_9CRYP
MQLKNGVSKLAVGAPARFRAASSSSASKSVWFPGESYPIIAVLGGGCALVVAILSRNSFGSNVDTWWTKQNRSKGVASWYESKYPGTPKSVAAPGARYSGGVHAH